ncbi:hypothetical protein DQG23_36220 [Paenibacillus contaminans]|uniref:Uncharacterized protein n=1 Tax=Paenibacillus contaminans TaxID=450362 RepID=A0A329LWD9_9BACL|nr:hypothetical protein DQG23_36220 [Paenibacillus contaminans]
MPGAIITEPNKLISFWFNDRAILCGMALKLAVIDSAENRITYVVKRRSPDHPVECMANCFLSKVDWYILRRLRLFWNNKRRKHKQNWSEMHVLLQRTGLKTLCTWKNRTALDEERRKPHAGKLHVRFDEEGLGSPALYSTFLKNVVQSN